MVKLNYKIYLEYPGEKKKNMKKSNQFARLIILLLTVIFISIGCGGGTGSMLSMYNVKAENPPMPNFKKYKNIHIGWLDLKAEDWKRHGYTEAEKAHWPALINLSNTNLRNYIKELLTGKNITGDLTKSDGENNPTSGDLYVKLILKSFDSGTDAKVNVIVQFIDIKTKNKLYQADLIAESAVQGIKAYSFGGRLDGVIFSLADVISDKIKGIHLRKKGYETDEIM